MALLREALLETLVRRCSPVYFFYASVCFESLERNWPPSAVPDACWLWCSLCRRLSSRRSCMLVGLLFLSTFSLVLVGLFFPRIYSGRLLLVISVAPLALQHCDSRLPLSRLFYVFSMGSLCLPDGLQHRRLYFGGQWFFISFLESVCRCNLGATIVASAAAPSAAAFAKEHDSD